MIRSGARVALALVVLVALAACGGGSTPAPTFLPGVPSPGCGDVCSSPNVPAACLALASPLAQLAEVESAIKSGSVGDGLAEGEIVGVQQALVNEEQQVGLDSPLGQSVQSVVSSLGELGVGLNANQPAAQLAPQLAAVDAALANLTSACQAAS